MVTNFKQTANILCWNIDLSLGAMIVCLEPLIFSVFLALYEVGLGNLKRNML